MDNNNLFPSESTWNPLVPGAYPTWQPNHACYALAQDVQFPGLTQNWLPNDTLMLNQEFQEFQERPNGSRQPPGLTLHGPVRAAGKLHPTVCLIQTALADILLRTT